MHCQVVSSAAKLRSGDAKEHQIEYDKKLDSIRMKKTVQKLTDEYLERYPIRDLVDGWFFRIEEVSNGVYEVEGTDVWQRKVSRKATEADLDEVLKACADDARKIQTELDKK